MYVRMDHPGIRKFRVDVAFLAGSREMLMLSAHGLPCEYQELTDISGVTQSVITSERYRSKDKKHGH